MSPEFEGHLDASLGGNVVAIAEVRPLSLSPAMALSPSHTLSLPLQVCPGHEAAITFEDAKQGLVLKVVSYQVLHPPPRHPPPLHPTPSTPTPYTLHLYTLHPLFLHPTPWLDRTKWTTLRTQWTTALSGRP